MDGNAIYQGFIDRGLGAPQAAALAGNSQQESSFNPAAMNQGSGAGGLFQWRKERLQGLLDFAKASGRNPIDPNVQMDYVVHELQGPESKAAAALNAATDIPSANAAVAKYLRYNPQTEAGNRLQYSLAFGNQGSTVAQKPDVSSQLDAIFSAPTATPAAAIDQDTSSALDSIFGQTLNPFGTTSQPGTPQYVKDAAAFLKAGGQKPVANPEEHPELAPPQDSVPGWMRAFSANAVEGVPIAGAYARQARNALIGPAAESQMEGVENQARADNPLAATAGSVFGSVAPLAAGGATALGAKALGTAADYGAGTVGNLLFRAGLGGLSSGAIEGADTLARGGSLNEAERNALLAGGLGVAASPAAAALGTVKGAFAKAAVGAGLGAAAGGAGTLVEGGTPQQAGQNALIGAGAGAGLGAATSAVGTIANRLMQGGVAPEAAGLADKAINQFGIPLGAADISSNPMVKIAKSVVDKMPFSGGTTSTAAQNAAFTRAVANEMGTDASALTPDVMSATRNRIGDVFDSVADRVPTVPADEQFQNDMLQAMEDAEGSLGADKMAPFNKQVDAILKTFGAGNAITGQQFLSLTDKKSILSKAIAAGGDLGNAASGLKDALYGAMERAAPADVLPDLQKARYQWKVMRSIEDNVAKSTDGTLSPPTLMSTVVKNFPNMAYDGAGNMGDLARIGQMFLKAPGSSNTAERTIVNSLLGGGGLAGVVTAPHIAIPALAGTLATSTAAGAAMRSKWLANSLIRGPQAFNPGMNMLTRSAVPVLTPPLQNALLSAAAQ
jgi:hypothetical protein